MIKDKDIKAIFIGRSIKQKNPFLVGKLHRPKGKWIAVQRIGPAYDCSICGQRSWEKESKCPRCRAEMEN